MFLATASALVLACAPAAVVDGRTLRCEGKEVRLVAILPGQGAPAQLQRLVRGQPTVCRQEGPAANGRLTARCWTEGNDLSCSLVKSGHATELGRRGRACR